MRLIFASVLLLASVEASASVITYTTRASFNSSATHLVIEDFETANLQEGEFALMDDEPLNSSTNNAIFSPGDIAYGISFDEQQDYTRTLRVLGPNAPPYGDPTNSVTLSFEECAYGLMIDLLGGNTAIGFDLYDIAGNDGIDIRLYSDDNLFHSYTLDTPQNAGVNTPYFVGFTSMREITRVTFDSFNDNYYSLDNIAFGDSAIVPTPTTIWLFAIGLIGLVGFSKRRQAA